MGWEKTPTVVIIHHHKSWCFFQPLIQVKNKKQQNLVLNKRFPAKFQFDTKIYFTVKKSLYPFIYW